MAGDYYSGVKDTSTTGQEGYQPILPIPVDIIRLLDGDYTQSDLILLEELRKYLNIKQMLG